MTEEQRLKLDLLREKYGNALLQMLTQARRVLSEARQGATVGGLIDYVYEKSEGSK
jgi:hypothetical protein